MKKLMLSQLSSIQDLTDNPLIEMASVDFHANGLLRVTVISTDDADFNSVDALLEDAFPHKEYRGSVDEDVDGDYYSIDVDGETLINLMMKKAPTSIEAPKEILHPDCIVNVTKVQSLLEPWYVEQILDERMGKG